MLQDELEQVLVPFLSDLGYVFWGGEIADGVLRVYVDKHDGVTLEDCMRISRQLKTWLLVEMPRLSAMGLEVSSPGVPRPLFQLSQYAAYIGQSVSMKLHRLLNGTRKITGVLASVTKDGVMLTIENDTLLVPFSYIAKAHVVDPLLLPKKQEGKKAGKKCRGASGRSAAKSVVHQSQDNGVCDE